MTSFSNDASVEAIEVEGPSQVATSSSSSNNNNNNNMNVVKMEEGPMKEEPTNSPAVCGGEEPALLDDPFAPRAGKHLVWRNVNMKIREKKRGGSKGEMHERHILQDVWGEVPPAETTAIMGPSGAGKSSLLNVLSGRAQSHCNIRVDAEVRVNSYRVDPTDIQVRKLVAYVEQDDSLQVTSTAREAIFFSAKLRLPRSTTDAQLAQLTEHMLASLGLSSVADTMVGGGMVKGLSGGERKRTSVGVELVVKPALVFLDEPTSGLDSFSAVQLCRVLKKVANAGSSVMFTIHQPASEVFDSFDNLILMKQGRILYQGPAKELPDVFAQHGHAIPQHHNPADAAMTVAQITPVEQLVTEGFYPTDDRMLVEAMDLDDEGKKLLGMSSHHSKGSQKSDDPRHPGTGTQIRWLFRRELYNLKRNKAILGARLFLTICMSTLIGVIFLNVAETDYTVPSNLQSSFGALMMAALTNIFSTVLPSIMQFPEERPVFIREYSTNHYSVVAYFCSRLTMEALVTGLQVIISCMLTYLMVGFTAPFGAYFASIYLLAMVSTAMGVAVGSGVSDPAMAVESLPVLFVPQILFAGFFVTPDLIPVWLRWLRYICPLTYVVRILLIQEFDGNPRCINDAIPSMNGCDIMLEKIEADPDGEWWYWLLLIILFCAFRLLALFVLRRKASQFY